MFSRKQLVIILLLMFTTSLTTGIMFHWFYQREMAKYLDIDSNANLAENKASGVDYYQQKMKTGYVGILLPNCALSGNVEQNWDFAQSFFPKYMGLQRFKTGPLPGIPDHTGFGFKFTFYCP